MNRPKMFKSFIDTYVSERKRNDVMATEYVRGNSSLNGSFTMETL
jgi:hypothetical protein